MNTVKNPITWMTHSRYCTPNHAHAMLYQASGWHLWQPRSTYWFQAWCLVETGRTGTPVGQSRLFLYVQWLEVLSYADQDNENRASDLFPEVVARDWNIESEVEMRKIFARLMDSWTIQHATRLPRITAPLELQPLKKGMPHLASRP